MEVDVFISYRRQGGIDIARNLYERLSLAGYNTFFDYDSMRDGMFNQQIFSAIEKSKDFVLVLTNGALDNCTDKNDWVRLEIEFALQHKKNIILVSPDVFVFPKNLPDSINNIKFINIIFLNQNYYNESIDRLIGSLSNRRKRHSKWVAFSTIALILVGCSIYFIISSVNTDSTNISQSDCTAEVYLMRYSDLSVKEGIEYGEVLSDEFYYQDSLDAESNYYIYPTSKYINWDCKEMTNVYENDADSIPLLCYHNPTIRLRLHSFQNKTLVFNKCYIDIESIKIDENNNLRFLLNDNKLAIINDSWNYWDTSILRYSWLLDGESFNVCKTEVRLPYFEDAISVETESDGAVLLIGSIDFPDGQEVRFFYNNKQKESVCRPSNNISQSERGSRRKLLGIELPLFSTEIELTNFNRNLVKGEIDDDFYFQISFEKSCIARIRLRLESIDGTRQVSNLYSNYFTIYYFKPRHSINNSTP